MEREAMSIARSASSPLTIPPPAHLGTPFAPSNEPGIVGSSTAMRRLRLQVRRIGPHFRTVLVSGEPGTGKKLVARALHSMSRGKSEPFVVCNVAAIEDALAEYEGGASATGDVVRLMKGSIRGTLFLDGISEMPLEVQGRLLRILTQYELAHSRADASQRDGSERIDPRIIASTSEDLKILVSTGRFRQELYQRLATVDITLPPLRERIEDLPELAKFFLVRLAQLDGRGVRGIADEAMERMQEYRWPGNVAELESTLRNTALQCEGEVLESRHLPLLADASEPEQSTASVGKNLRLQDVVEQHVLRVLKDCGGNKLRAAEMLGISRSTLYRMLDAGASVGTLR
jgi:DNA-binding NtrC family response regulator